MKVIVKKSVKDLKGIGDKLEEEMNIPPMTPVKLDKFITEKLGTQDYYVGHMPDVHKVEFLPNDWRNTRSVTIEL